MMRLFGDYYKGKTVLVTGSKVRIYSYGYPIGI